MTFATLSERVRAHLGQSHRYAHTVRVARCADVLAQRHGLDGHAARTAGMLHDLARLYSAERLIAECEARAMSIDAFERAHPIVLHARLGAAIARESFGIRDAAVLSAIEKHTLGAAAMQPLDCVLYLADGLEPKRNFARREALWELAQRDLAAATAALLRATVAWMTDKGMEVAPQTLAAIHGLSREVWVSAS